MRCCALFPAAFELYMGKIVSILRDFVHLVTISDSWTKKVLDNILKCGTGELGVSVFFCQNQECNHIEYGGATCGSRNCPNCGGGDREEWAKKVDEKLFPINHFHAVFTIPHQLNGIFATEKRTMLNLLMNSVSETITKFANSDYHGEPAFIMVLHTWTQELLPHYHVHVLIAAGTFSDGHWQKISGRFLFPIHALSKAFRGIFLEGLLNHNKDLSLSVPLKWNVYCAAPYGSATTAVKYFATYANRCGISDGRILDVVDGCVKIRYKRDPNEKDSENGRPGLQKGQKLNYFVLSVVEFIKRFIVHILPSGFHKIRYGGLYHSRSKHYEIARSQISAYSTKVRKKAELKVRTLICPKCQLSSMIFIKRNPPNLAILGPPEEQ